MISHSTERLNPNAPAFAFTPAHSPLHSPLLQDDTGFPQSYASATDPGAASASQPVEGWRSLSPQGYDDCISCACPSVPPPMRSRLSPSPSATTFPTNVLQHLDPVDCRIAMVTGYPPPLPSLIVDHDDAASVSDMSELSACRDCLSTCDIGHAPFLYFGPVPEGPQPKIPQEDAVSCLGQELWRAMSLEV